MLCYCYYSEKLNEKDETQLGTEAFENIYELFSYLLYLILSKDIKKGVYKDYNDKIEATNIIKGKINLNESITSNTLFNKKMVCEFDELNENTMLNQVIKTTIHFLLISNKIQKSTKILLNKLNVYYVNVDFIEIRKIKWDKIIYNKNNMSYKFIIDICKMILNGLVVSNNKGKNKFKEFLDDTRVSKIYENFIRAYYKKNYPMLNARSENLYLTNTKENSQIPIMKTDITLNYGNRTLIIDAKFYSEILKNNYYSTNCKTISSNNIYQILAYVDSKDPFKKGNVAGMLLYAQTVNEPEIDIVDEIIHHTIAIKTLDLNKEWINIKQSLNNIADKFINDEI